ncbi:MULTISPECIES: hypothetical protein [unclassified Moorena]|uniref:hypothetical protein n=1 Tax=unclassified Moorena TaxID=2683338 RepID=UPI0013B65FEA|nr:MULTISPECIES: hypothetical protein [unclassified Moorena]NEP30127.1 hypothetical protein [Moorena sp. SIO3B2]NER88039.1 hypothetical protein [Moorena sp. SIO3A2]NES41463.1 hypothetical protein [Moorena sp. SIO2C4]
MSSPAKGPYRSRLFNFINRQSQRFVDQIERTTRHLKVAAVWGGQILLYPVYLLVQASLSAGRQISSSVKAGLPQLRTFSHAQTQETPPEADTAIQRVLQELNLGSFNLQLGLDNLRPSNGQAVTLNNGQPILIERQRGTSLNNGQPVSLNNGQAVTAGEWATPNQTPAQAPTNEHMLIQGVACLLDNRGLVLVTVQNQILDILTPQQQQKLASRISWEVADLMRKWRLAHSLDGKKASPSLATLDHPPILPPIRLFWRLMAWVQTSPVAIAINLFGESRIIRAVSKGKSATSNHRQPKPKPFQLSPSSPIQDLLTFLDNKLLELESHQLLPGSEVVVKLRQALQKPFIKGDSSEEVTVGSDTNRLKILSLIYAAIDYFFGRKASNFSLSSSSDQSEIASGSGEVLPGGNRDNLYPEAHQLSGDNSPPLSPSLRSSTSTPSGSKSDELEPWLTDNDLWGNPDGSDHSQNFSASTSNSGNQAELPVANLKYNRHQLPEGFNSKIPVKSEKSIWTLFKRYLHLLKAPGKLIISRNKSSKVKARPSISQKRNSKTDKSPDLSQIQDNLGKTTPKESQDQPLAVVNSGSTKVNGSKGEENSAIANSKNSSDLEPDQDWIETQATPEGYIKHPLERVLEWLDITILWIEELVVKIWRLLQRLWPF